MKRRSFIKKSGIAGFTISVWPQMAMPSQVEYSILELMGKEDIELFGKDINLRKEAYDAFMAMKKAAAVDGIDLKVISGYRNFMRQEIIWEKKYTQYTEEDNMAPLAAIDKIVEYSTIPGTSRHHWGTDLDIVDGNKKVDKNILVPEKFNEGGPYAAFKQWMDANANTFDFYLIYTDDPKRRGFKHEPWHYSYAPLSVPMLTAFRGKNILQLLGKEDFMGIDHFTTGFINTYIRDNILDINTKLL